MRLLFAMAQEAEAVVGKPFVTPDAGHLFNYEPLWCFSGTPAECSFGITFPTLIMFGVSAVILIFFTRAFSNPKVVPTGIQNLGEAMTDLIPASLPATRHGLVVVWHGEER